MRRMIVLPLALTLACGGGEGDSDSGRPDAGRDGGGVMDDAGRDAGGSMDAGGPDAGPTVDAGVMIDAGPLPDGGVVHTFPPRDYVCRAGETTPCETTQPLRSAAERTVIVTSDMPSATLTYVVSVLGLPEASAGVAPGFNLDGLDSGDGSSSPTATCVEYAPDLGSALEPGHVGVDNVLSELVPTMESLLDETLCGGSTAGCVDRSIAQMIASGALLLLVEIDNVDSLVHDPDVTVGLYLGAVPGGGAPVVDGTGRLAPGQTFTTVSAVGVPVRSDIFHGRVRVLPGTITLPMSTTGVPLPSTIANAELRADVSLDGLSSGHLGGSTPLTWFVEEAERASPGIGPTVEAILESYADIEPTSDPIYCADISSGLTLEAVRAVRTP